MSRPSKSAPAGTTTTTTTANASPRRTGTQLSNTSNSFHLGATGLSEMDDTLPPLSARAGVGTSVSVAPTAGGASAPGTVHAARYVGNRESAAAANLAALWEQMREQDLYDALRPYLKAEKLFLDNEDATSAPIRFDMLKSLARKWRLHTQTGFWTTNSTKLRLANVLYNAIQQGHLHTPASLAVARAKSPSSQQQPPASPPSGKSTQPKKRIVRGSSSRAQPMSAIDIEKYKHMLPTYKGDLFGTRGDYTSSLVYLSRYTRRTEDGVQVVADPLTTRFFLTEVLPGSEDDDIGDDGYDSETRALMDAEAQAHLGAPTAKQLAELKGKSIRNMVDTEEEFARVRLQRLPHDLPLIFLPQLLASRTRKSSVITDTDPVTEVDEEQEARRREDQLQIQRQCSRALKQLSYNTAARHQMVAEGAVAALKKLLTDCLADDIREDAMEALCNLSSVLTSPPDGTVAGVCSQTDLQSSPLRSICASFLFNMSTSVAHRTALISEGCVAALIDILLSITAQRDMEFNQIAEDAWVTGLSIQTLCNLSTVPQGCATIVEEGTLEAIRHVWRWLTHRQRGAIAALLLHNASKSRGFLVKLVDLNSTMILSLVIHHLATLPDRTEEQLENLWSAGIAVARLTKVTTGAGRFLAEGGVQALLDTVTIASALVPPDGFPEEEGADTKQEVSVARALRLCAVAVARLTYDRAVCIAASGLGLTKAAAVLARCRDRRARRNAYLAFINILRHKKSAHCAVHDCAIEALLSPWQHVGYDDLKLAAQALFNASCHHSSSSFIVHHIVPSENRLLCAALFEMTVDAAKAALTIARPGAAGQHAALAARAADVFEQQCLTLLCRAIRNLCRNQSLHSDLVSAQIIPCLNALMTSYAPEQYSGQVIPVSILADVIHAVYSLSCSFVGRRQLVSAGMLPQLIAIAAHAQDSIVVLAERLDSAPLRRRLAALAAASPAATASTRRIKTRTPGKEGRSSTSATAVGAGSSEDPASTLASPRDSGPMTTPSRGPLSPSGGGGPDMSQTRISDLSELSQVCKRHAALTLCNLTCEADHHDEVIRHGALPALIGLCNDEKDEEDGAHVRGQVARALHIMSARDAIARKMVSPAMAQLLVGLCSSNQDAVRQECVATLFNLSRLRGLEAPLVEAGAVRVLMVVAVLRSHQSETQRLAMQAVHNLMANPELRAMILAQGVVFGLQKLASADSQRTRRVCVMTLLCAAYHKDMLAAIIENGGVKSVVRLLYAQLQDAEGDDVAGWMLTSVLAAMIQYPDVHASAVKEGAVGALTAMTKRYLHDLQLSSESMDKSRKLQAQFAADVGVAQLQDIVNDPQALLRVCLQSLAFLLNRLPPTSSNRKLCESDLAPLLTGLATNDALNLAQRHAALCGVIVLFWRDEFCEAVGSHALETFKSLMAVNDEQTRLAIAIALQHALSSRKRMGMVAESQTHIIVGLFQAPSFYEEEYIADRIALATVALAMVSASRPDVVQIKGTVLAVCAALLQSQACVDDWDHHSTSFQNLMLYFFDAAMLILSVSTQNGELLAPVVDSGITDVLVQLLVAPWLPTRLRARALALLNNLAYIASARQVIRDHPNAVATLIEFAIQTGAPTAAAQASPRGAPSPRLSASSAPVAGEAFCLPHSRDTKVPMIIYKELRGSSARLLCLMSSDPDMQAVLSTCGAASGLISVMRDPLFSVTIRRQCYHALCALSTTSSTEIADLGGTQLREGAVVALISGITNDGGPFTQAGSAQEARLTVDVDAHAYLPLDGYQPYQIKPAAINEHLATAFSTLGLLCGRVQKHFEVDTTLETVVQLLGGLTVSAPAASHTGEMQWPKLGVPTVGAKPAPLVLQGSMSRQTPMAPTMSRVMMGLSALVPSFTSAEAAAPTAAVAAEDQSEADSDDDGWLGTSAEARERVPFCNQVDPSAWRLIVDSDASARAFFEKQHPLSDPLEADKPEMIAAATAAATALNACEDTYLQPPEAMELVFEHQHSDSGNASGFATPQRARSARSLRESAMDEQPDSHHEFDMGGGGGDEEWPIEQLHLDELDALPSTNVRTNRRASATAMLQDADLFESMTVANMDGVQGRGPNHVIYKLQSLPPPSMAPETRRNGAASPPHGTDSGRQSSHGSPRASGNKVWHVRGGHLLPELHEGSSHGSESAKRPAVTVTVTPRRPTGSASSSGNRARSVRPVRASSAGRAPASPSPAQVQTPS